MLRARKRGASRSAAAPSRIRLDLAFIGTPFRGWQSQAKGATVQDALEAALRAVDAGACRAVGCSRTDAGVHARRYTAHVEIAAQRRPDQLLKGLNSHLPSEIRVYRVSAVEGTFHARYSCVGKTYRYVLHLGPVVPPPLAPFVWLWQGALDEAAMAEAAALFLGERDYSAFTTSEGRAKNTRRTIRALQVSRRGPLLEMVVEGPSFLHRMVRCMAGALAAVGTGRLGARQLERALDGDTSVLIHALPAQALHLWEVTYPGVDPGSGACGDWPKAPSWPLPD